MVDSSNNIKFGVYSGTALIILEFRLDSGVKILFNYRVDNDAGIAYKCNVDSNIAITLNCSLGNGTGIAHAYGNNKCS